MPLSAVFFRAGVIYYHSGTGEITAGKALAAPAQPGDLSSVCRIQSNAAARVFQGAQVCFLAPTAIRRLTTSCNCSSGVSESPLPSPSDPCTYVHITLPSLPVTDLYINNLLF